MAVLNKHMKQAIIRSVMADLPASDIAEKATKEFHDAAVAALPTGARRLWSSSDTRVYVNQERFSTQCGGIYGYAPAPTGTYNKQDWIDFVGPDVWQRLADRCSELRVEKEKRDEMRRVLEANFDDVRTCKQFEERFPELVKYLPAHIRTPNLPATTDLVERLKAAGLKLEVGPA